MSDSRTRVVSSSPSHRWRAHLDSVAIDDADEIGRQRPRQRSRRQPRCPTRTGRTWPERAAHPPRIRTTSQICIRNQQHTLKSVLTQGAAFAQLCDPMALGKSSWAARQGLRQKRGLSQEELAERSIARLQCRVEHRARAHASNFTTLERLSEVLGVPVREFFDHQPDASDNPRRAAAAVRSLAVHAARDLSDAEAGARSRTDRAISRTRPKGKRKR